MGLDMYLTLQFSTRKEDGLFFPTQEGDEKMRLSVGYWRKANAVHKWFVNNAQGGNDDCKEYEVATADLEKLRGICEGIITKATECGVAHENVDFEAELPAALQEYCASVLPSSSGFFFGGTEYDGYYLWQVFNTQKIIDTALSLIEHNYLYTWNENHEKQHAHKLFYQSSW